MVEVSIKAAKRLLTVALVDRCHSVHCFFLVRLFIQLILFTFSNP